MEGLGGRQTILDGRVALVEDGLVFGWADFNPRMRHLLTQLKMGRIHTVFDGSVPLVEDRCVFGRTDCISNFT